MKLLSEKKSYMYDFFMQINLALVDTNVFDDDQTLID
jgi:hypothetical protein